MRVVKSLAWEDKMRDIIEEKRGDELAKVSFGRQLSVLNAFVEVRKSPRTGCFVPGRVGLGGVGTRMVMKVRMNITAARAMDREFNCKFGSNLGLFGSGRGSKGHGAPIGSIWADVQLNWSHDDPFHDRTHAFVIPVAFWC